MTQCYQDYSLTNYFESKRIEINGIKILFTYLNLFPGMQMDEGQIVTPV